MAQRSITQFVLEKECTHCHETKPITEFSVRVRYGNYQSWCRSCIAENNLKQNKPHHPFENVILDELKRNGIYAVFGRGSKDWTDIMAWGCIRIEVKSSILKQEKSFVFRFSRRQQEHINHSDVIILACRWDIETSIHVFRADDPHLLNDGERLTAVCYSPFAANRRLSRNNNPLTEDVMMKARNRWSLIEERRIEIAMQMRQES